MYASAARRSNSAKDKDSSGASSRTIFFINEITTQSVCSLGLCFCCCCCSSFHKFRNPSRSSDADRTRSPLASRASNSARVSSPPGCSACRTARKFSPDTSQRACDPPAEACSLVDTVRRVPPSKRYRMGTELGTCRCGTRSSGTASK